MLHNLRLLFKLVLVRNTKGPVATGIANSTKPMYSIFGHTVLIASQLESSGVQSRIQISQETYRALKHLGSYIMEERVKCVDQEAQTYWLLGKN